MDLDTEVKPNHKITNNHIDPNRNDDAMFSDDELDVDGYNNDIIGTGVASAVNGKRNQALDDDDGDTEAGNSNGNSNGNDDDDDDDNIPLSKVKLKKEKGSNLNLNSIKNCEESFDAELKLLMSHLKNEKRNEHMEAIVSYLLKNYEDDNDGKYSATLKLTSIFLVTLRIRNFLTIQFWSLSDLVSEYRVRFDRLIKKFFHFRSKSVEK